MSNGQNIIELGFSIDTLSAQKQEVLTIVKDLFKQLDEYSGTQFNPLGGGGLADLKKSVNDSAKAMGDLATGYQNYNKVVTEQAQRQNESRKALADHTAEQKAAKKIQDDLLTAQAKLNVSSSDGAKELAQLKLQQQQANAANKDAAKEALGLLGEYDKLKKVYNDAANASKQLGAAKGVESEEYKTAAASAKALHDQLLTLEGDVGQKGRDVGNYAQGFKEAFGVLQEELSGVNKQLAEMETRGKSAVQDLTRNSVGFDPNRNRPGSNNNTTALTNTGGSTSGILNEDSAAYAKLTLQQKILEGSLERQTIGFKTANQEMRNAKTTLDSLALAGLGNSEAFEKLNLAYTSNEQKVKDLHQEQAILSSDAPAITALTGIAKGLGGAYALSAGGAALFADGNEKVEKELQELVAVMTFLQGLEEATKALKDRNALSTALQESATKALNVVKEIEVRWFGKEKAAIVENTAIKEVNAAATEVNTEATAVNTVALEAEAAATVEAEAATIGLSTALLTTGLGAAIIAIGASVAFLVKYLFELAEADTRAAERSADLAESLEKTNEILIEQIKLSNEAANDQKKNLENALTLAEKNKSSEKDLLAIRQSQADLNKKTAEDDLKKLAKTNNLDDAYQGVKRGVDASNKSLDALYEKQKTLNEVAEIYKKVNDPTADLNISQARYNIYYKYKKNITEGDVKDQLAATEKEIAATKKLVDTNTGLLDAYDKTNIDKTAVSIDEKQHSDDEKRKITLDTATREANAVKAKNQLILDDDRSTLAQRLEAIKSNAEQEVKIAAANRNDALARPGAVSASGEKSADAINAENDFQDKRVEILATGGQKQYQTTVEWNDKLLTFLNDINKNALESDAATQDAISKDLQKELEARLTALYSSVNDRAKIIADDYALQIKLAKEHNKTQEEQDKLASDRDKALVELTSQTQKQIYDITISWGEKKMKAIQDLNKSGGQETEVTTAFNAETEALNESLLDRTTSYSKYLKTKRGLDREYMAEKDAADVEDDAAALKRIKDFEEKELASKKRIADANLLLAGFSGDNQAIKNAKSEVDAIAELQAKARIDEKSAADKLNKDKAKQTQDSVNERIKAEAELQANVEQLESKAFDVATSLVNGAYETRINQIQHTMELEDAASQNQIAAVQRSTLSQRDQAATVIILQAQQQARDTSQKREMAKEKQKEAKFDRDMSVAKAIWSTGEAIMKTFEEYGGTPIAYAVAASIAALGAVEVATILSQPIPTYAEGIGIPGKGQHPGGLAWVGEEYKPEEVKIPGQDPFVVSTPTLLDMPGGSSVTPLEMQNIIHDIGWGAISRGAAIVNAVVMDSGADRVVGSLDKLGTRIERAFKKNQQKIKNIVHVHLADPTWESYLDQKVRGRR